MADHPVPGMGGSDAVEYYGGHLIAESIAPQNRPLIAAAPDLYDFVATLENDDGKIPAWLWEKREKLLAEARGEGLESVIPPSIDQLAQARLWLHRIEEACCDTKTSLNEIRDAALLALSGAAAPDGCGLEGVK